MVIAVGFQPNRGPLPGLTWKRVGGKLRYDFTDADGNRCSFFEIDENEYTEPVMGIGLNKRDPAEQNHYFKITKDSAYWLSQALLTFANTGKLP